MAQLVKNLPTMQKIWVLSLGWEAPMEKGKAIIPVFWPGEFHGLYSIVRKIEARKRRMCD